MSLRPVDATPDPHRRPPSAPPPGARRHRVEPEEGARRPNDQGSSARHRTSRSQPPATDSTHRLAQGSRAPLGEVVVLPAARGCDDQPAVSPIRGGAPTRTAPAIRVDARAAVCPKRSPSPLLISSPAAPDRRPSRGRSHARCRSALRPRTTLIRLLIRPTGGPGRCRRPRRTGRRQGTPKRPDLARVTPGHRHRAWWFSTQEHRNDTHSVAPRFSTRSRSHDPLMSARPTSDRG